MSSTVKKRAKQAVTLDATKAKGDADKKLLSVMDAFTVPGGSGEQNYMPPQITYVNHHGLEVPGFIIFDGARYRTSRVTTYETLTEAAMALVRGD